MLIGASLGNTATGWVVATLGLKVSLGFYTLPLIGIDSSGHAIWLNGAARRVTGCRTEGQIPVETVFGASLERLLAVPRQAQAQTLHLPDALGVWMKGTLTARDGADFKHAVATAGPTRLPEAVPTALADTANENTPATAMTAASALRDSTQATLFDHKQRLTETTLAAYDGNIAKAARALSVSRGMLYRRLRERPLPPVRWGQPGEQ